MNQKKINHIIISGLASFFYFLIVFSILGMSSGKDLLDTPFMMALYLVPCVMLIYGLLYNKINSIIKNKYVIAILVIIPLILFIMALASGARQSQANKTPDDSILENGKEIFDNAEDFLDQDDFNIKEEDTKIEYKKEQDLILKEDSEGNIRQFKPIYKDEVTECDFKIYELKKGYILACTYNENINFYSKEAKDDSVYYKLNIPKKHLANLEGFTVAKLNTEDEQVYKKYTFNNVLYYTEQTYDKLNVYKQFNGNMYLYVKSYNLKDETAKYKTIRSWYEQKYKIVFVTKEFDKFEATFELNEDLTLNPTFTKQ